MQNLVFSVLWYKHGYKHHVFEDKILMQEKMLVEVLVVHMQVEETVPQVQTPHQLLEIMH